MTASVTPTGPQLDRRHRLLVLAICSMSLLIVGLDTTIVNVALPSIHRSLDASVSGLQWTIDAYTLVIASLLMLSGSTADRFGRKRVFRIGLVVFTLGSALCAAAPSLDALIAARVLQAIGASMLNPVAMSIIRNVFEDPRERAQAIGIWGAVVGISLALGPVVGGALVDTAGWRSVFLVNVPVGLVALVLTTLYVPESRAPHARALDPVGQLLVIVALASLTYGIIEGPEHGFTSARILAIFAISLVSFVGLVRYERRRPRAAAGGPLLPLGPVLRCQRDRGARVRRARRLSVPEHPLPPGGPTSLAVPGGAVHAAAGRDDADLRAAVRADHRGSRRAVAADERRLRADAQPADADAP